MVMERCTFPLPKRVSGHLGRWSFRSLVYCTVVAKTAFRITPGAKPDLASQATSKNDTPTPRDCRSLSLALLKQAPLGFPAGSDLIPENTRRFTMRSIARFRRVIFVLRGV